MLKETPKYIIYKKEMPSKKQSENDSLEYNNHMSHQGNAVKCDDVDISQQNMVEYV